MKRFGILGDWRLQFLFWKPKKFRRGWRFLGANWKWQASGPQKLTASLGLIKRILLEAAMGRCHWQRCIQMHTVTPFQVFAAALSWGMQWAVSLKSHLWWVAVELTDTKIIQNPTSFSPTFLEFKTLRCKVVSYAEFSSATSCWQISGNCRLMWWVCRPFRTSQTHQSQDSLLSPPMVKLAHNWDYLWTSVLTMKNVHDF